MRVIFMGTPEFAVPTLKALKEAGHDIVLVVTQPDRPRGRGRGISFSPVKEAAAALGIPVYQPGRIRDPDCGEYLKEFGAEAIVAVAYGQILPAQIIHLPPYGCVNVHASLLPKYRGASPIQWAVINGDEVTGVTTMLMDEGLDTGDILLSEEVALSPDETGGSLSKKLSLLGAKLCVKTLDALVKGELTPKPQVPCGESKVGRIDKKLGHLDFSRPAAELERLIRGLDPQPGTYTVRNGKTLKVIRAAAGDGDTGKAPGTVVKASEDSLGVQTGEGILFLLEVQPEGKNKMGCGDYLRGYRVSEGEVLS